jgi:Protein of unknown function (DUF2490)
MLGFCARAQTSELLPEIDTYLKLNPAVRIDFQAKETRESGDPVTAEIGPSLDFYVKHLRRLDKITQFDLDDSKSQLAVFTVGYRYLPTPGEPPTNRMRTQAIFYFPLKGRILFSDQNRADLNWSTNFTWRYRNRLQLERVLAAHSYHPAPYLSAEFFYESQFAKWSDTAIYAGCLFPLGKHVEFNPYYEHQNNTSNSPNSQLNQLGLMLNLYFTVK